MNNTDLDSESGAVSAENSRSSFVKISSILKHSVSYTQNIHACKET